MAGQKWDRKGNQVAATPATQPSTDAAAEDSAEETPKPSKSTSSKKS